jgi:hypothetical protein
VITRGLNPQVEFGVSRAVNEFCHISVLYSELMPVELATGMLGNKAYKARNAHLRRDEVRLELQRIGPFASESEWYRFATGLMKRGSSGGLAALSGNSNQAELFRKIRQGGLAGFEEIWTEARPRLEEYKEKFESEWSPIGDKVLYRLSRLAKNPWTMDKIRVHFVDCLFGGFGWNDCIGFAAFPDLQVQKKFLAHELSELITPRHIVGEALRKAGLNSEIAHTVVDMLAYFSVRDFLTKPVYPNPERKGIKPNPNYYPAVEKLYPAFELYAENPSIYTGFEELVQDMIAKLKVPKASPLIENDKFQPDA